jgi:hypothetical protein
VPGGLEDPLGVLDPHDLVGGRMKDEERPVQVVDPGLEILASHVIEELLRDGKSPPGELHFSLSLPLNRGHMGTEAGDNVLRVGGRADRHHRFHLRQGSGGRQNGRAAE